MDYRKLHEKHARSLKQRGYIAIAAGVLMLKQLRDEQQ